MRKFYIFAVFAAFGILLLAGCAEHTATRKSDVASLEYDYSWRDIIDAGVLKVGIAEDLSPFVMQDESGRFFGFDVELIGALCDKLHVGHELVVVPEDQALSMLQNRQIDVLWNGYSPALERNDQIKWLDPYLCTNQVVVCTQDAGITSMAQLDGKQLGVVEDTLAEINAKSSEKIDDQLLARYADGQEAIADLAAHRLDGLLIEDAVFYYYTRDQYEKFMVLDEILDSDMQCVGVQKGFNALAEQLKTAFDGLKEDGTLRALSMEWFDTDLTV